MNKPLIVYKMGASEISKRTAMSHTGSLAGDEAAYRAVCEETGAAMVLLATAHIGLPVSTTHTITSSVIGVGVVKRLSAVRWGVTARIVYAWIFTLPGAAVLSVLLYKGIIRFF